MYAPLDAVENKTPCHTFTPSPCLFNTPHDVPPLRSFPEQFLGLSEVTAGGKAIGDGNSIIVKRCSKISLFSGQGKSSSRATTHEAATSGLPQSS